MTLHNSTTAGTLPKHEGEPGPRSTMEARLGARVCILPRQRVGGDRYAGREGVIVRTHFAGFYVRLDMTPRERTEKTALVETAYLEVLPRRDVTDDNDQGDAGPFIPRLS